MALADARQARVRVHRCPIRCAVGVSRDGAAANVRARSLDVPWRQGRRLAQGPLARPPARSGPACSPQDRAPVSPDAQRSRSHGLLGLGATRPSTSLRRAELATQSAVTSRSSSHETRVPSKPPARDCRIVALATPTVARAAIDAAGWSGERAYCLRSGRSGGSAAAVDRATLARSAGRCWARSVFDGCCGSRSTTSRGGAHALSEIDFGRRSAGRTGWDPDPAGRAARRFRSAQVSRCDHRVARQEPRSRARSTAPCTSSSSTYWQDMSRANELVIAGQAGCCAFRRLALRTDEALVADQIRRALARSTPPHEPGALDRGITGVWRHASRRHVARRWRGDTHARRRTYAPQPAGTVARRGSWRSGMAGGVSWGPSGVGGPVQVPCGWT